MNLPLRRAAAAFALAVLTAGFAPGAQAQLLPPLIPLPGQTPPPPPSFGHGPVSPAPGSISEGVDVAHTGFFADDDLVPPLKARWNVAGAPNQMLAAEGKVYLIVSPGVTALDQGSGRQVWVTSLPSLPRGAAYDAGVVFVSTDGQLHAVNASTGARLWSAPLAQSLTGAPVASGGVVYITQSKDGGTIYAFRGSDGASLWTKNTAHGSTTTALDNERVYVAGACADAQALKRSDGSQAWSRLTGCTERTDVTPALFGGRLYVPQRERTNSGSADPPVLDAATGNLAGRFRGSRPVFVDGLSLFGELGGLSAVNMASGALAWRSSRFSLGALAIGHDVYGINNGKVIVLDAESGMEIWTAALPDGSSQWPETLAAAPGLLIAAARGRVVAYESVFKPPAGGIVIADDGFELKAGGQVPLVGVLGRDLRAGKPLIRLFGADWRGGPFRLVDQGQGARDGFFGTLVRTYRNTRYRVSAAGATSNVVTAYAYPDIKLGRFRSIGRTALRVGATVRTPGTNLVGRTFVLYLKRKGFARLDILASGRLRGAGSGRTKVTLNFTRPRGARARDLLFFCVRGALGLGLGRPRPITRGCGARRLPGV